MKLAKNNASDSLTNHLVVKVHIVCERLTVSTIELEYYPT